MSGFARKIQRVSQQGATLTLSPVTNSYANGATVSVLVYVNSGSTPINGVQANLTYPTAQLTYQSFSNSGSPFSIQLPGSGGGGNIQLAVGEFSGQITGKQLVGTITFTAAGTGSANVAFAAGCLVTRSSDSSDILSGTRGATYTIT